MNKTLVDLSRILFLFDDFRIEELSVTEISSALGMYSSKVSRMLSTLETEGYFERDPKTSKYHLGFEFFTSGVIYSFHLPLRKIIRPHIEEMANGLTSRQARESLRIPKIYS